MIHIKKIIGTVAIASLVLFIPSMAFAKGHSGNREVIIIVMEIQENQGNMDTLENQGSRDIQENITIQIVVPHVKVD